MLNYLETEVDKLIQRIIDNGLGFGWKNHPNRNHVGFYLKGEPFDYCIFTSNYKWCFDAKMVQSEKWYPKAKDIKQACNLKKLADSGMESFFLILWEEKHLRKLDINKFLSVITDRKYILKKDCDCFDYKVLFS